MGLKPQRTIIEDDISYFMNTTGVRGVIVFAATGTSGLGTAMDSSNRVAEIVLNPSGRTPIGMLLQDVVNLDLSRQIPNWCKRESQVGEKVHLGVRGVFTTDMLHAGMSSGNLQYPVVAYAGPLGRLLHGAGYAASGYPVVGKFLTSQDAQAFAQVRIDIA